MTFAQVWTIAKNIALEAFTPVIQAIGSGAQWIYDNCSLGTHVNIDPYTNSGPFDKPAFEPLPSWHTWDPTDPTAAYLCQQYGCH